MHGKQMDMFRQAFEKVSKSSVWKRLTPAQRATLISKYLETQYTTSEQNKT